MNKSKAAFLFSSQTLGKQQLYLWTFTFAELLGVKDTRKRWNHLLTLLLRTWPDLQGLRVFELHREHGLHVHLVTNQFIDVNRARELAEQAGWGRIHVCRMPSEHAGYLAKYLSKDRPDCLKRWRLWAGFGRDWSPMQDVLPVLVENLRKGHLVDAENDGTAAVNEVINLDPIKADVRLLGGSGRIIIDEMQNDLGTKLSDLVTAEMEIMVTHAYRLTRTRSATATGTEAELKPK